MRAVLLCGAVVAGLTLLPPRASAWHHKQYTGWQTGVGVGLSVYHTPVVGASPGAAPVYYGAPAAAYYGAPAAPAYYGAPAAAYYGAPAAAYYGAPAAAYYGAPAAPAYYGAPAASYGCSGGAAAPYGAPAASYGCSGGAAGAMPSQMAADSGLLLLLQLLRDVGVGGRTPGTTPGTTVPGDVSVRLSALEDSVKKLTATVNTSGLADLDTRLKGLSDDIANLRGVALKGVDAKIEKLTKDTAKAADVSQQMTDLNKRIDDLQKKTDDNFKAILDKLKPAKPG